MTKKQHQASITSISVCVGGLKKEIVLNVDGHLKRAEDWSVEVAEALAQNLGIKLQPIHWRVVYFLQSYYEQYGVFPLLRVMISELNQQKGECQLSSKDLYDAFELSPLKQGALIAGLPKPPSCF